MPSTTRDGAELYWEEDGAGPPLILAAGLGGAGTWWDVNRPALAARFKLYIFDQRGTGRSSKVPVTSIEQMSADVIAIMDAAGLESAHYLGHSTGAAIGVATALDDPARLRSLCIYASTTCGDPYRRRVLGLRNRLYQELGAEAYAQYSTLLLYPPYWINANDAKLAAAEAAAAGQLGSADVQASRLDAILAFDRRAEFGRIAIPTLVVCTDDDILTPRYFSEEYARLIPNARSHWVARGGHALSRTEPALFNSLVLEFFTEVAKR
jgi:aminoacrylate hydrolase